MKLVNTFWQRSPWQHCAISALSLTLFAMVDFFCENEACVNFETHKCH